MQIYKKMHFVPNKLAVFMNKIKKTIYIGSYQKILITFANKIKRIYEKVFVYSICCRLSCLMP